MTDNNKSEKSLISINLPECVDNAVKNLTDKPSNTIGQTISDCLYLVFGGISQKAALKRAKYDHELKQFTKELENKIEEIPESNRLEPNVQVVCLALDNMKYCVEEEELRRLFSALIANSINIEKSQLVHPSYGEIIKQLTPFDARLFEWLKSKEAIPLLRLRIKYKSESKFIDIPKVYLESTFGNNELLQIGLDNLSRLKLIELQFDKHYSDKSIYDCVVNNDELMKDEKKWQNEIEEDREIIYSYGVIEVSYFGEQFFAACN